MDFVMETDALAELVLAQIRLAGLLLSVDLVQNGLSSYREWFIPTAKHRFQFYFGIWMFKLWFGLSFY